MSDQPSDPQSGQPSDQPSDESRSARPPLADSIRAKMEEYDVDRHLGDLASTLEGAVRQGVAKAGSLVHEHKGDIDRLLEKAVGVVDRHTDGKHADRISQVRGSLERGVDRIAEQRDAGPDKGPAAGPDAGPDAGASDVPPSNG
ncbi:MAG TPA: antitoxin [Nocardioides sp.]|uniref:antitoxin n=1 Tax=Nocardioides sp. TaxID=35761 RepID=UPI002E348498|nr:antitoxin [Nocardioides sp.]HEX3930280.1 antitoxin [Nocardioides sp.]